MEDAVLFLCVANSSRSQMAEGLARRMLGDSRPVASAGSSPTGVNPFAVAAMAEVGVDLTTHRSTAVADVDPASVGLVITLCAEEVCPVFPARVQTLHEAFPDPAAVTGTDEEKLASFREVRDRIQARLEELDATLRGTSGTSSASSA